MNSLGYLVLRLARRGHNRLSVSLQSESRQEVVMSTKVCATGIDTLRLAVYVEWGSSGFPEQLGEMKEKAKREGKEVPGRIEANPEFAFSVQSHGSRGGFEFLLLGRDMKWSVGRFGPDQDRPNLMVDFSSEVLWRRGVHAVVSWFFEVVDGMGGCIKKTKVSRADLCADVLVKNGVWDAERLTEARVCRARKCGLHWDGNHLEGVSFGAGGHIQARIYDKVREIKKSRKTWLYDIWRYKKIPGGRVMMRVEFELHREVLKELKVHGIEDLLKGIDEVWGYCSKLWLQMKSGDRGIDHKLRKTLDWWEEVQKTFFGVQVENSSVREHALKANEEMLKREAMGFLGSLTALEMEKKGQGVMEFKGMSETARRVIGYFMRECKGALFIESVVRKRVRYRMA